MTPTTRSRLAAAVTAALALVAWALVRGPIADRARGAPADCQLPAECLADLDLLVGAVAAVAVGWLGWLVVLAGLLGLSSIAIGWLVGRRWPDHAAGRVVAALLTVGPVALLAVATGWLAVIAAR